MKSNWRQLVARTIDLFCRRKREAEMSEEIQAHFAHLVRANLDAGMSETEARELAQKRFGSPLRIKEDVRGEVGFPVLEQWGRDAFFALRSLIRSPGVAFTLLLTLIAGFGVAVFTFRLTASTLFFASPYPHAGELRVIGFKDSHTSYAPYRFAIYLKAYQEQTEVFSSFAGAEHQPANVVVNGSPVGSLVLGVSTDFFATLGIQPVLGRRFLPEEFRPGQNNVVILSDLFWRQRFNADPGVINQTVRIDDQVCTVVGVLAQNQALPAYFKGIVYRPLMVSSDPLLILAQSINLVGRLKPGVTDAQAEAALSAPKLPSMPQWASGYLKDQLPVVLKLETGNRPEISWLLLIGGIFLYVIATLNAVNLLLVRLISREHEIGIRLSLGGTRWQVMRLLGMESGLITLSAAVILMAIVRWVFPAIFFAIDADESVFYRNYLDGPTVAVLLGLCALAGLAIVLFPLGRVWQMQAGSQERENAARLSASKRLTRVRTYLVVTQASLAVILLIGTGLMIRTFQKLREVDLGFDPTNKVKLWVLTPRGYEPKAEERLQLFQRIKERLSLLPGVKAVSYGQDSLLVGDFWGTAQLKMADSTFEPVMGTFVSEDLAQTAGLRIIKGQWLSGKRGAVEAVINETMARRRFGETNPIGQSFKIQVSGDTSYFVVGVVKDIRENVRAPAGMHFYIPSWMYVPNVTSLLLRLDREPKKEFADQIRRTIYTLDPTLVVPGITSLSDVLTNSMAAEHAAYNILRGFTVIALGLAIVGLFSVIAFAVNSRMKEFGIRVALGATPAHLRLMILRKGVVTAIYGVAIGIAAGLGLTRFMQSLLFETTTYDPIVYVGVSLILILAAALASWLPAQRASSANVAHLLKNE